MEFSLLGAAALGVGALYAVLYWEGRRGNAAECSRNVWDVVVTSALIGFVVGRLAAMILAGTNPLARPADIIVVRGGIDTFWASLAALVAFTAIARREVLLLADAAAGAVLAGLAGWHAGCLLRDGCLGTRSDLPWAWPLPGSDIARHPVELYAAVGLAVAAVAVLWLRRRRPPPGVLGALALAAAAGIRWATEPLRPTLAVDPTLWYVIATVAGAAAAVGIGWRGRRVDATTRRNGL